MVVLTGIGAVSQILLAIATGAVAWVAYRAFVGEDREKKDARKRLEDTGIIQELIVAIEVYSTKVSSTNLVSVDTVGYFVDELAKVQAAIAKARVHGHEDLVIASDKCVKAIKALRNSIVVAKRKRPNDFRPGNKRPPAYAEAMDRSSILYDSVLAAKAVVLSEAGKIIGTQFSDSSSAELPDRESETTS
jgi:hypothetical protein